jgi:hypothetical protein
VPPKKGEKKRMPWEKRRESNGVREGTKSSRQQASHFSRAHLPFSAWQWRPGKVIPSAKPTYLLNLLVPPLVPQSGWPAEVSLGNKADLRIAHAFHIATFLSLALFTRSYGWSYGEPIDCWPLTSLKGFS